MAGLTTTPLREQLVGGTDQRRPGPLDAFLAARRRFQAGERELDDAFFPIMWERRLQAA